MKITTTKVLTALITAGLIAFTGNVSADSAYGYQSSGTGTVTASTSLKVKVTIPKLIILKVGTANAVDTLELAAAGVIGGTTGALTSGGASTAANWDHVAPTFTTDEKSVNAYIWTNADSATLTCSSDTGLSTLNLAPKDIKVNSGGSHPGATTACGSPVSITRNTVMTTTWKYSLDTASLAAAYPGSATQTTTYVASAP
ncbi:MAG TPA: hypothetical protein PLM98_07290 [Thiolinea sp.]|nr:hypothetical protein [Thiolinea sp.]